MTSFSASSLFGRRWSNIDSANCRCLRRQMNTSANGESTTRSPDLAWKRRPSDTCCRCPDDHRDPFDRMLICQALHHDMVLATTDRQISRYPVKILAT